MNYELRTRDIPGVSLGKILISKIRETLTDMLTSNVPTSETSK